MKKGDPKSLAGRPDKRSELLGQVFTPERIARHMARGLLNNRPSGAVKILDPCVGPFTFPQAIIEEGLVKIDDTLLFIDIDTDMIDETRSHASAKKITSKSICTDYLLQSWLIDSFDYAILNPPYVRQEWIDDKYKYQRLFREQYNVNIPGTSNLYVYFIVKTLFDLKPGGSFACIVYDSWQSTKFGYWLVDFLKSNCDELKFETIPGQPFKDRLIDATIIYGAKVGTKSKSKSSAANTKNLGRGHSIFSGAERFCTINDAFDSKRGLRLKQADFFMCNLEEYKRIGATPFIKKVGRLNGYRVPDEHQEAALLIANSGEYPEVLCELHNRIDLAKLNADKNISILTWYAERPDTWMLHRKPPHAPLLFNYYLRNRPRHIYNPSRAYSDNFYGLTPLTEVSPLAWLAVLNSTAVCAEIMAHSRNQGSGLAKIQLFEYREICVPDIRSCTDEQIDLLMKAGLQLISESPSSKNALKYIDDLLALFFPDPRLEPSKLIDLFERVDKAARNPRRI